MNYKDEIAKILADETYQSNDERLDAISKNIAPLIIPKDKFNEQGERLKAAESKYDELLKEFETFKETKMTDEEKNKNEREKFAKEVKDFKIKSNKLEVERILTKAGLTEEEYKEDIDNIVSEDLDKSLNLANFLVKTLNANSEKVKIQTQEDLMNATPKPVVGTPEVKEAAVDDLKAKLDEAIKSKDSVEQARLMRLIQETEAKSKNTL